MSPILVSACRRIGVLQGKRRYLGFRSRLDRNSPVADTPTRGLDMTPNTYRRPASSRWTSAFQIMHRQSTRQPRSSDGRSRFRLTTR